MSGKDSEEEGARVTPRARSDGFGEDRKRLFVLALRKGESVLGACRLHGISNRAAYNHRGRDPQFAHEWDLARQLAVLPIELAAFERAVTGVEEPVYAYGRLVHVRRRRSDSLFRTLLAGEKPGKYGPAAGLKAERKRLKKLVDRQAADAEALKEALSGALARLEALEMQTVNFVNRPARAPAATGSPLRRDGRRPRTSRRTRHRAASGAGTSVFPRRP